MSNVSLNEKGIGIASTTIITDTETAASIALFTVPTGKKWRTTGVLFRNATGTLIGGSVYGITGWRQAFSLAELTTALTGYIYVLGADLAQYTEVAAGSIVYLIIGTGSTTAYAVTVDLIGILSDA